MTIHSDVNLYASLLSPNEKVTYELPAERHAYLFVVRGTLAMNGMRLGAGDGAAISEERALEITGRDESEFLLFDLP